MRYKAPKATNSLSPRIPPSPSRPGLVPGHLTATPPLVHGPTTRPGHRLGRYSIHPPDIIQRQPVSKEEAQRQLDSLGKEKWRELIDAKDHESAETEVQQGQIPHPGDFYNYKRLPGGRVKMHNDPHKNFLDADDFVHSRLTKRLTAREYHHINQLISQGDSSPGFRAGPVTWGLPSETSHEELLNLKSKGLTASLRKDGPGYQVNVPAPKKTMAKDVEEELEAYYGGQEESKGGAQTFSNIARLYSNLEAMHPFKDGTSRTNHLVLNKLLAEHGLGPAILDEPNSPTHSQEDVEKMILRGILKGQEITKAKGDTSGELAQDRGKRATDRKIEAMTAKLMGDEPPPSFKPYGKDPEVETHRLDLDPLLEAHGLKEPAFDPYKSSSIQVQVPLPGTRDHVPAPTLGPKPKLPTDQEYKAYKLVRGKKAADDMVELMQGQLRRWHKRREKLLPQHDED